MKKLLLAGLIVLGVTAYAENPTTSADDTASVLINATGEVVASLEVVTGDDPDDPYDPDTDNQYIAGTVLGEHLKFGTMVQGETRDTTTSTRTDVESVLVRFIGQPDYDVEYYFSGAEDDSTAINQITLTLGGAAPADATESMVAELYLNGFGTTFGRAVAGGSAFDEDIVLNTVGKAGVVLIGKITGGLAGATGNASDQKTGDYSTSLYVNARYDQSQF